jgi:hypothetical protein
MLTDPSQTAIDISNYSGELTPEKIAFLRANASLVIVRLSTENGANQRAIAAQQVAALAEAGIPWQGYIWSYWDQSPVEHWEWARELLPDGWPGYHKLGIWLDCEDPSVPAVDALDWINSYASLLRADGFVPGVYTGLWWVRRHDAAFRGSRGQYWAQFPLWWASYRVKPACLPSSIGPWQSVAMHQYQAVEVGSPLSSYDLSLICDVP